MCRTRDGKLELGPTLGWWVEGRLSRRDVGCEGGRGWQGSVGVSRMFPATWGHERQVEHARGGLSGSAHVAAAAGAAACVGMGRWLQASLSVHGGEVQARAGLIEGRGLGVGCDRSPVCRLGIVAAARPWRKAFACWRVLGPRFRTTPTCLEVALLCLKDPLCLADIARAVSRGRPHLPGRDRRDCRNSPNRQRKPLHCHGM